jgi:diacylglycerol O-acyltransferase
VAHRAPRNCEEMDAVDALLLRADDNPPARLTMLAIYVLDRAPDWTRVRETMERASRVVPRLRQRALSPSLPVSRPYWVDDGRFDLSYHVRRMKLPGDAKLRDLLDSAQLYGSSPLDRSRPLWEASLVEGLDAASVGGPAALVVKTSHAMSDGIGGMAIANAMLTREPDPPPQPMPDVPPSEEISPGQLVRMHVGQYRAAAYARARDQARQSARFLLDSVLRPEATRQALVHNLQVPLQWVGSLGRTVLADTAPPSPALRDRGYRRRFSVLDIPLRPLRDAARIAGGSVNDAYLAAVLGGVGRYHQKLEVPIETIHMAVPVSLRRHEDPATGGNHFGSVSFRGPVHELDPAARVRQVRELVLAGRSEPAVDVLGLLAPVLARVPSGVLSAVSGQGMRHDLQASNIPGYQIPVYFAGAEVRRLYPFGPAPGVAAMIVLLSYAETCYVGVHVDLDAVREPELFDACLEEGFAEVLALPEKC